MGFSMPESLEATFSSPCRICTASQEKVLHKQRSSSDPNSDGRRWISEHAMWAQADPGLFPRVKVTRFTNAHGLSTILVAGATAVYCSRSFNQTQKSRGHQEHLLFKKEIFPIEGRLIAPRTWRLEEEMVHLDLISLECHQHLRQISPFSSASGKAGLRRSQGKVDSCS